jgi:hypothetical protein
VTIAPGALWDVVDGPPARRELARTALGPVTKSSYEDLWRFTFATTARIPADLRPGRYTLTAGQQDGVFFGFAEITVVRTLPDTGAPVADLLRLGVLSLVTGAGSLAAGRRRR